MPEFFLECFGEEIPARFQARGAEDFCRLVAEALAPITPRAIRSFYGPRRIALAAEVADGVAATSTVERGPRLSAPEQALAGFLRKHCASRDSLRQDNDFWVLEKTSPAQDAAALIAAALPAVFWRFPWQKSMRWGGTSAFTWVRPLRRILCLLDGATVPFTLATPEDDGHGLASSGLTEGHRFLAPGAVEVDGLASWLATLRDRKVIPEAAERMRVIQEGIAALAAERGLVIVEDQGLLEEVAGLVEWPVPLLGRIDEAFMDLPPEVMQVSMRVNQRYFALRGPDGKAAPWFAFAANNAALDGGAAIIAGNERVLRARFSDARHFWDLDRRMTLADRVAALDSVTFQAELGSQGARARRLQRLARVAASFIGADEDFAERAGLLAKADLTTGMVGEFPELQGIMGGYYAAHDGEPQAVCQAIRDHYAPKGLSDTVPSAPVTIAVALADKLDQLAGFFAIGQKPRGSGDPYALRRAALGVVRIIRENALRVPLRQLLHMAASAFDCDVPVLSNDILAFITERLRVQLRAEGARHDVLAAVFAAGADDDLSRALARTEAIAVLLKTDDGANLLAAYKRAANILRIEDRKDGPHRGEVDEGMLRDPAERALQDALRRAGAAEDLLRREEFAGAMACLAALRQPLDAFFDEVTVNAGDQAVRLNRLNLLFAVRSAIDRVADFSQIEISGAQER
jgi:glycyl-tRNA synthetase beta chain